MSDYDPNYIPHKSYVIVGQKAVVQNAAGKILVLQRSVKSGAGGKWSLPGGALEVDEQPYESIRREIEEETSLQVHDIRPFFVLSYQNSEGDKVVMLGYQAATESDNVQLNWEHDAFRWVDHDEALELDLTADGRSFLERFSV